MTSNSLASLAFDAATVTNPSSSSVIETNERISFSSSTIRISPLMYQHSYLWVILLLPWRQLHRQLPKVDLLAQFARCGHQ